jgi:hypothetical protein
MSKASAPQPTPDHDDNELPIASPKPQSRSEPSSPPPEPDPLAKWRAAREMEEEMADVFDEDRVTHKHGDTEPEAD